MSFKKVIKQYLQKFDIDIVRRSANRTALDSGQRLDRLVGLLGVLPENSLRPAIAALPYAKSQLGQDVLALAVNGFKKHGFFVEFGATDGITLSNTWLLEKIFEWNGILAEPARIWHKALGENRGVAIDHECVWSRSAETLKFSEVPSEAELSTLSNLASDDRHANSRRSALQYEVKTVSLNDLLARHGAPQTIDFLSIDTEGSEFEILDSLDWSRWRFNAIACEHNFTANRDRVLKLLTSKGYTRVYTEVSDFDDWYVRHSE